MNEQKLEEYEELTLEDCLARLEETIGRLDTEGLPLEESFALYKQGVELVKQSNRKIERVEKQVLALTEDGELDEF